MIAIDILAEALLPLAGKFYRSHCSPMRAAKGATVWVARQQEIIAALSVQPVANGHWLTGLFVAPQWRGQAVARRLLEQVAKAQTGPVWLFCHPQLTDFYQRAQFVPCADLPAALAQRLQRYSRTKALVAMVRENRLPS